MALTAGQPGNAGQPTAAASPETLLLMYGGLLAEKRVRLRQKNSRPAHDSMHIFKVSVYAASQDLLRCSAKLIP